MNTAHRPDAQTADGDVTGAKPSSTSTSGNDNPRLVQAVQEYVAAVEAGRRPNRRELLARYPDIAQELSACLHGLQFLDSAAAEIRESTGMTTATGGDDELPMAEPLGDFRLIREIGRGGMGVVYEAMQTSLGRRVAVKVLPFAAALDQRQLQRFRNEAQMAAQLHHTNIVPVYAVGCERSIHFYAMQLIDGQSLAEVIHDLRRAANRDSIADAPTVTLAQTTSVIDGDRSISAESKPSNAGEQTKPPKSAKPLLERLTLARGNAFTSNLSSLHADRRHAYFRTVAQLGVQAAEALDHAHQAGVVHRDIKPANLLLDTRGTVWVTDFGLAQLYADTGLTQPGDTLGTFRYMSPEQASGRNAVLDQRTDVYSLGLTLYELLTLERAVRGDTRLQMLRQIESVDPVPARALDRSIPVELETILAKAVAKDPSDRYQSAREMADDLERYLRDEPIRARPPTLSDKAIKWVRRHKTFSLSALMVLMLTTIALLISTILIARAQNRTKTALVEEQRQRDRADRSAAMARDAVSYFTRVAAEDLPRTQELLALKQEMLETSMRYYQAFLADPADAGTAGGAIDAARSTVATILGELGEVNERNRLEFGVRLLDQTSVQQELGLTKDQVTRATTLQQRGFRPPGTPTTGPAAAQQMRQALKTSNGELREGIEEILTPDQRARLKEISRQLRGLDAFDDPDVAPVLALSDQQKALVDRLERSVAPDRRRRGRFSDLPDQLTRTRRAELVRSVVETFDASQRRDWAGFVGKPFTGVLVVGNDQPDGNRPPPSPDRANRPERSDGPPDGPPPAGPF